MSLRETAGLLTGLGRKAPAPAIRLMEKDASGPGPSDRGRLLKDAPADLLGNEHSCEGPREPVQQVHLLVPLEDLPAQAFDLGSARNRRIGEGGRGPHSLLPVR